MPMTNTPALIEEPQEEAKHVRKGVAVNYDYNTTVPNYVFNPALWQPSKKGRKPSVDAMLCYLWCIDKVTSVYEDKANLGISYSSVQRNMQHLEQAKLIRRVRGTFRDKFSYEVLNCRKKFNGKQADGTIRMNGKTYIDKRTQQEEVLEFLDERHTTSFNLEGEDDELN